MAECNWDPAKHKGEECPTHGGGHKYGKEEEAKETPDTYKGIEIKKDRDEYMLVRDGRLLASNIESLEEAEDIIDNEYAEDSFPETDEVKDALDINDEDKELFEQGIKEYGYSLNDIEKVRYLDDDPEGFDGGYEVTLKNGDVKRYGWRHNHVDYGKLFEIPKTVGLKKFTDDDFDEDMNLKEGTFTDYFDGQSVESGEIKKTKDEELDANLLDNKMKSGYYTSSEEIRSQLSNDVKGLNNIDNWELSNVLHRLGYEFDMDRKGTITNIEKVK